MKGDEYSDIISDEFNAVIKAHKDAIRLFPEILTAAKIMINAIDNGNKILILGNGGSAADASHMSAELVGRFKKTRYALPAIALTTDTSIITAIANDFGYDQVFVRQCNALAKPGDVIFAISTSGKSTNILKAIVESKKLSDKIITIALTGKGGDLSSVVNLSINVPADSTSTIQAVHRTIIHSLCRIIDEKYGK